MVVARLHSDVDGVASGAGSLSEGLREEMHVEELISTALIDEDHRLRALVLANELTRVVGFTSLDRAEILLEGILTERLGCGSHNGSKRRHRLEHARVLEMNRDGTVAAHAVTRDGPSAEVNTEEILDESRQLPSNVSVVLAVLLPLRRRSIDIEASAGTDLPVLRVGTLNGDTARRSVREHDSQVVLGSMLVNGGLGARILISASEARQVEKNGGRLLASRGTLRNEDGERHFAIVTGTPVLDSLEVSALNLVVIDLSELRSLA